MPWHVARSDQCPASKPFAVIKDGTSEVEGCHESEDAAQRQMAALYASERGRGKALMPVKAQQLDPDETEGWLNGKLPRRILVIPFGGPIPSPHSPRGVDLDGEWFSERTDLFGGYKALLATRERAVDWHHSFDPPTAVQGDPTGRMTGAIVGKAVLDEEPDEDGHWADLWIKAGEKRVALIKALARRSAALFGSSQAAGDIKRDASGEILRWPLVLETLTTSPQNTHSVVRPYKAVLDDLDEAQIELASPLKAWLAELDALQREPSADLPSGSDAAATAMRLKSRMPDLDRAWDFRKP